MTLRAKHAANRRDFLYAHGVHDNDTRWSARVLKTTQVIRSVKIP